MLCLHRFIDGLAIGPAFLRRQPMQAMLCANAKAGKRLAVDVIDRAELFQQRPHLNTGPRRFAINRRSKRRIGGRTGAPCS